MRRRKGTSIVHENGHDNFPAQPPEDEYEKHITDFSEIQPLASNTQICVTTSILVLAIYVVTLHASVPGGDSGELIVSAHELGVAHPPGYPLFTIVAKLAMVIIPFRNPAWRVNFITAVMSCIASGLLQYTVLRLTNCVGSSLMAVGLFSLCRLTWTWSVSSEVFGMNNMFIALLMVLAVDLDLADRTQPSLCSKKFYWLAFVSGLALCNQHTVVMYVLLIAVWAAFLIIRLLGVSGTLFKGILCGLLGLTPYLYLPFSSYLNVARWTWGDQNTIGGFLTHFLRVEYGTFDLSKDNKGSDFVTMISAYMSHVQSNMCELGPWLALIGVVAALSYLAQRRHCSTLVFALMCVFYTVLFAWRANLDISNPLFKGVVERFWMQSDLVVSALAAVGYHTAVRMVTEKFLGISKVSMTSVFTTMGAGILIALQLKNNYAFCNHSGNLVVRDFARTILDHFPPNTIVLTKGDLPTNSMRYLHLCENVRRDLQLLDVEILSYEWSLPKLRKFFPRIVFPGDLWKLEKQQLSDGRQSFNFKMFLDANYKKYPIYVCIGMQDRDPSWQPHYTLWPSGVCHRVVAATEQMDPKQWANITGGFGDKWTHPSGSFNAKSWERVANDEMWHSKISSAFYMYKQGEAATDAYVKTQFLVHAYELYFRAIKLNQRPSKMSHVETFPTFWHKNFALACERLLHLENTGGLDKIKLCKLSIYHFQQYVHLTPQDPDNVNINNAISILQQRLDTYNKIDKVDATLEKTLKRVERLEEIGKQAELLRVKQQS